jgi:hypothetical protein
VLSHQGFFFVAGAGLESFSPPLVDTSPHGVLIVNYVLGPKGRDVTAQGETWVQPSFYSPWFRWFQTINRVIAKIKYLKQFFF